jgi:hypothetical protein
MEGELLALGERCRRLLGEGAVSRACDEALRETHITVSSIETEPRGTAASSWGRGDGGTRVLLLPSVIPSALLNATPLLCRALPPIAGTRSWTAISAEGGTDEFWGVVQRKRPAGQAPTTPGRHLHRGGKGRGGKGGGSRGAS